MKPIPLHFGDRTIPDISRPTVEDVDLREIWLRLCKLRRFGGHELALTVRQHLDLCWALAVAMGEPWPVIQWAERHDMHEAVLGDWIAPVRRYLETAAPDAAAALDKLQERWDEVIARATDMRSAPDIHTRRAVHRIDLIARRIEMEHMGIEPDEDLPEVPEGVDAAELLLRVTV